MEIQPFGVTHHAGASIHFSGEASTLGFSVGEWPATLQFEHIEFYREEPWYENDELRWMDYVGQDGSRFRIYND